MNLSRTSVFDKFFFRAPHVWHFKKEYDLNLKGTSSVCDRALSLFYNGVYWKRRVSRCVGVTLPSIKWLVELWSIYRSSDRLWHSIFHRAFFVVPWLLLALLQYNTPIDLIIKIKSLETSSNNQEIVRCKVSANSQQY